MKHQMKPKLDVDIANVFLPLLQPSRYKGVYGGRGSGKSHFFAELLVLKLYSQSLRAVCIREIQRSIRDSVKQLIKDKIEKFGLDGFFSQTETEVRGANGSLIIFKGMQAHNAQTIKSLEGLSLIHI